MINPRFSACLVVFEMAATSMPNAAALKATTRVSTINPSGDLPRGVPKTRPATVNITTTCKQASSMYASIFPARIAPRGYGGGQ